MKMAKIVMPVRRQRSVMAGEIQAACIAYKGVKSLSSGIKWRKLIMARQAANKHESGGIIKRRRRRRNV